VKAADGQNLQCDPGEADNSVTIENGDPQFLITSITDERIGEIQAEFRSKREIWRTFIVLRVMECFGNVELIDYCRLSRSELEQLRNTPSRSERA
jgi:hypothetical protein